MYFRVLDACICKRCGIDLYQKRISRDRCKHLFFKKNQYFLNIEIKASLENVVHFKMTQNYIADTTQYQYTFYALIRDKLKSCSKKQCCKQCIYVKYKMARTKTFNLYKIININIKTTQFLPNLLMFIFIYLLTPRQILRSMGITIQMPKQLKLL